MGKYLFFLLIAFPVHADISFGLGMQGAMDQYNCREYGACRQYDRRDYDREDRELLRRIREHQLEQERRERLEKTFKGRKTLDY